MSTPTTSPFLPISQVFSQDSSQFLIQITKFATDVATAVNVREVSIYTTNEGSTGEQWFTPGNQQAQRQTFRKAFNLGPIAIGATQTTAHGITQITEFTDIYATCITDVAGVFQDYRPIPYVSATAVNQQIEMKVDGTNIVIINGAASPHITSALVVLEFLKN